MAEEKVIMEREYVVPLRKAWLKVARYKRVPKAVKALKEFVARHMKIYDRDLKKVKLDKWLNVELWHRGIKKPPAKIKIIAKKLESGIVKVELAEIPEVLKWKIEKEKKRKEEAEKIKKEKKKREEEKEKEEKEEKEKKEAVEKAEIKEAEKQHKEVKHEVVRKAKKAPMMRKALEK